MAVLTPKKVTEPLLQCQDAYVATLSDNVLVSADAANTKGYERVGVFVGTGGDVKVTISGGSDVTFKNVPSGTFLPVLVTKIWSTGTGASDIIALA